MEACPICKNPNLSSKEIDLGGGALGTRYECDNCGGMFTRGVGEVPDCVIEFGHHTDHTECEAMLRNMNPPPYDERVFNWEDRTSHWVDDDRP